MGRVSGQHGFSLVEALVAMVLVTMAALALASTMLNAAQINNRNLTRQQALAVAAQQIDRFRSLDYEDIGMSPASNAAGYLSGAYTSSATPDLGRCQPDWARGNTAGGQDTACTGAGTAGTARGFCPLAAPGGGNASLADCTHDERNPTGLGRIVTRRGKSYNSSALSTDPQRAKITSAPDPSAGQQKYDSTVLSNGIIVYTYVYRPVRRNPDRTASARCPLPGGGLGTVTSQWCPALDRKVITVMVRYRDAPAAGTGSQTYQDYASVRLSTVVAENTGVSLKQIPQMP